MKKVLVLGGGFAGIEVAIELRKNGVEVTLISDRDYFYIYPISIWIPTGEKTKEEISVPLKDIAKKHGFEVIVDKVIEFNAFSKKVTLDSGKIIDNYEYIVLALGQDKMQKYGLEHTLSICGDPKEAVEIHERLESLIKKGHGKIAMGFGGNPKDSSAVRGGPIFELLFNIENYLKIKGVRDKFELTFFASMPDPGLKMGKKAPKILKELCEKMSIHVKTGVKIIFFKKEGILFEDGEEILSDLIIFIAAGKGHSVIASSGVPLNEAGFVITNEYNEVEGFENVYAIGDSTTLLGEKWGAKQGHLAEVMARNVAYTLFNKLQNIESKRSYLKHLKILCLMDTGKSAVLVFRSHKYTQMIPLPFFGHWLKRGWGWYCRNSKLGRFPRLF